MSLPRYPEYKDSEVEWLGDVPVHWSMCSLKRVASLKSGESITADSIEEIDLYPVYGGNGLRGFAKGYTHDGYFALIGRQGALCGNINYASGQFWASEHAVVISPIKPIATTWLGELLRAMNLNQYSVSAAQPGLSVEIIMNLEIPYPPVEEQTAIATFLHRETAKIDGLIAEQEKLIALLTEKRQATISHAVTKGLNPDAPMKDSGVAWLGEVPAHWEIVGLTKYIQSVIDYRGRTPTKVDEGVFLVTAKNIRNGAIDYDASQEYISADEYNDVMRRGIPEIGDVLFTTEAPLGQVAQVDRTDIALAQRVIKFRGDAAILDNSFLKYWVMGSHCQFNLETLATGSTALGIKGSKVGQVRLCLPPFDEQPTIAAFLDTEISRLNALTAAATRGIALLKERRSALISAAVTGKIDVRHLADQKAA